MLAKALQLGTRTVLGLDADRKALGRVDNIL